MKTLRLQSIFARVTACMVCLALSLTMIPSASAAQTATAPSWIDKSEYVTFSDGAAYQSDMWNTITTLRNYAQSGGEAPAYGKTYYKECETLSRSTSPSVQFELGLIKLKFALNAVAKGNRVPSSTAFEMACYYAGANDEAAVYQAYVWNARLNMLSCDLTTASDGNVKWFFGAVEHLLGYEQFTMAELLDWGAANGVPTAGLKAVKDLVFVTLDRDLVHPGHVRISNDYMDTAGACIRNDQVMVPVRRLAELMGAVVAQNTTSGQAIVSRAGDTITLTPNSKTAYINGAATTLTVVPFMESNQIYVSVDDLADWFGQAVTRSKDKQLIEITEDKSVAGSSNLEQWAISMGALLLYENNPKEANLFGGKVRYGAMAVGSAVTDRIHTTGPDFGRTPLATDWGITNREGLFAQAKALIASNTTWDLCRVSHLAQWGYLSGYVTYAEALAMVQPAAETLCSRYSNWKQLQKDYLEGYMKWAGLNGNVWTTERGKLYDTILNDPNMNGVFDNTLFRTGVIGLPELSFDSNGGSEITGITAKTSKPVKLTSYVPTRAGFAFSGWFSDKELTKAVSEVKLDRDTTVYAKWIEKTDLGFTDVADNSPFRAAIGWAVKEGITNGTSATTFSPGNTCTTAQILTFLWRANGSPNSNAACPASDVAETSPFYKALCWANEKDLMTKGSGSTPCTRAAAVTYLWKLAGSPKMSVNSSFTDVPASADFAQAVAWAVEQGVTNGVSASEFAPDSTCTRGQIVTFLYRNLLD